jgi:hypothetical protein
VLILTLPAATPLVANLMKLADVELWLAVGESATFSDALPP